MEDTEARALICVEAVQLPNILGLTEALSTTTRNIGWALRCKTKDDNNSDNDDDNGN